MVLPDWLEHSMAWPGIPFPPLSPPWSVCMQEFLPQSNEVGLWTMDILFSSVFFPARIGHPLVAGALSKMTTKDEIVERAEGKRSGLAPGGAFVSICLNLCYFFSPREINFQVA